MHYNSYVIRLARLASVHVRDPSIDIREVEMSNSSNSVSNSALKPVFHFNRIVAKRSVFHCFVSSEEELMIWRQ